MSATGSQQKTIDETVLVLDFMPEGKGIGKPTGPVLQIISERMFSLRELFYLKNLKPQVSFQPLQMILMKDVRVPGRVERERMIMYEDLTEFAQGNAKKAVELIVDKNEPSYVRFFNNSGPITTRLHQLELLPGIGKKYLWEIIKQRKLKPFSSFQEISERVKITDPKKIIIRRILLELSESDEKYFLFVPRPRSSPPLQEETSRYSEEGRRRPHFSRTGYQ